MATSKVEGKRSLREISEEDEEETEDEDTGEDDKKKKGKRGFVSAATRSTPVSCQADDCDTNLSNAKPYHRRHKVCEHHAKASVVAVAGIQQRFCQQCSRFHEVLEFDDNKRSCRRRLAGHNERRRKSSSEYHGEGSI